MANKIPSRGQLLDQWSSIEDEEDNTVDDDPSRLHRLKEQWFADAFNFLVCLPKETHIWCSAWEIMGPLLETFYNYYKDERQESPLRLLWKRISDEMCQCVQCICQYHQAQDMYSLDYESSSIGPLLDVLHSLDEERLTQQLKEINSRIRKEEYNPLRDNTHVVCTMYEVLMFPVLLDDQFLFTEFEIFIEIVDNMHDLALAGHQQFPGVYALLFFNRRVRTVGRRLARSMEKLRGATDLEPLQPLLKKYIGHLESDVFPSANNVLRPRVQLDRQSVWIGITSLLEFLEPPAFEEGILEHYPSFLDMVLNNMSGDSAQFSHAVCCLREIFKIIGCKLWLRSPLSPNVMRNTLLGQCFHTRNEKIHTDIFYLFQPFLQSLEALQDGEHEKQRRHFLFFLLHQVPVSSNFSNLTRKTACKIAFLIIHRGYKMDPPCPPFTCAHIWGPSLVSCLKDSSLHNSLQQPAFDLIQTIIISDATALMTSMLNECTTSDIDKSSSFERKNEEVITNLLLISDVEDEDCSSWNEFSGQSKISSSEYRAWMCIPQLWVDALVEINPSIFPLSYSKAVFWARSHLTMIEPETSGEMALPVKTWLSSYATEISFAFGWKVPTGIDDDGRGNEYKNSIEVPKMCSTLIKVFNRLTAHFVVQTAQGEARKLWIWEPRMSESLILSLADPNDDIRQIGKCIVEQVSKTRGLAPGLRFLCSSRLSLTAVFVGLSHALEVVQLESVLLKFQILQHIFFLLRKVISEAVLVVSDLPEEVPDSSSDCYITKFSSQGGFLRQPVFESLPAEGCVSSSIVNVKSQEIFCCLLSEIAWPSICKCLVEGKAFMDYSLCQMTCVRLLEILPVILERHPSYFPGASGSSGLKENVFDLSWLHDLMDWGKSSLKVVIVYWKRTVTSVLNLLKKSCDGASTLTLRTIESIVSCETLNADELANQVSHLCVSLSKKVSCDVGKTKLRTESLSSELLSFLRKSPVSETQPIYVDRDEKYSLVVLSDDETEQQKTFGDAPCSESSPRPMVVIAKPPVSSAKKSTLPADLTENISATETPKDLVETLQQKNSADKSDVSFSKQDFDVSKFKPIDSIKSGPMGDKTKEMNSKSNIFGSLLAQPEVKNRPSNSVHQVIPEKTATALLELVHDANVSPWEAALKSARQQQTSLANPCIAGPKRQLIQLRSPAENKAAQLRRRDGGAKRFKAPRLDDWYRPILEIDYFMTMGLTSSREDENHTTPRLKEVPVSFRSPEQYVDIFRPLVLEEFKAQLHSSFMEMSSLEEMYSGFLSVLSVERVDDFHLVRFSHGDNDSSAFSGFFENDLVLLTKEPLKSTSHDVHMVGKVERRERDGKRRLIILIIRFFLQNGTSRLNHARRNLMERSKWHASRIMNMTPQLREFQALTAIKDIPMLPVILEPINNSSGGEIKNPTLGKLAQPLQQKLKSSFNESQLQAISIAIGSFKSKKEFELSLIQGPPGTGKTRTIMAIVSSLLASTLTGMNGTKYYPNGNADVSNISCVSSRLNVSPSVAIAKAWQDAALARQLNVDEQWNGKSTDSSSRARILICAQSNAAVDELISRMLNGGIYGSDGKIYNPYVVRVGNVKTVHPNSLPFFIDTLVDHRLAQKKMTDTKKDLGENSSAILRANLENIVEKIRFFEAKRANLKDVNSTMKNTLGDEGEKGFEEKEMNDTEVGAKLKNLYGQKNQIYKDLSAAQARERKSTEETKGLRHKLRKSILREAEVVVSTLSGCGGDLYGVCSESISSSKFGNPVEHTLFDAVVIDEAAQALEPATLIPLQLLKSYGTKCIMVGDPKQLPATVLSNVASKFHYQCSMFERLQKAGHPVTMLTNQYRMHPEICRFPSFHFYENKLLNGDQMSSKSAPFHEIIGLGPYVFYDIADGQELRSKQSGEFSLYNEHEADAAVEVLRYFKKRYPSEFSGGRIGIVTPYKCQISHMRSRFSRAFETSVVADMEFNTVDGFQGREVDILVLSTVRAADSRSNTVGSNSIGFVSDVRRMNVALTRAKLSLWIFGNAKTLETDHNWAALLNDARDRNLLMSTERPYAASLFRTEKVHEPKTVHKTSLGKGVVSENDDKSSSKKDVSSSKRVREGHGNDLPKTTTKPKEHIADGKNQGKDRSMKKLKRKDEFENSRPKLSNEGADSDSKSTKRSEKNLEVSVPLVEESRKEGKSRDRCVDPDKEDANDTLAAKRKQKRDDVDAILHSSLIPTKKSIDSIPSSAPMPDKEDDNKSLLAKGKHKQSIQSSKPLPVKEDANETFLATGKHKREAVDAILHSDLIPSKKSIPSSKALPDKEDANETFLAKRKHKREAVDAILHSALIPSKKSIPSSKPLPSKRSLSPVPLGSAAPAIKRSKKKKVPSTSSFHE